MTVDVRQPWLRHIPILGQPFDLLTVMLTRHWIQKLRYGIYWHKWLHLHPFREGFSLIGRGPAGRVHRTDRHTGRSKGFAFVEMAEDSAAQEAIAQFSGKELDGREINVAEARPQEPRDNRNRGGGGRRY
jgi:hypothetical protein